MNFFIQFILFVTSVNALAQNVKDDWYKKVYHEDSGFMRAALEQRVISRSQSETLSLEKNCTQDGGRPLYDNRYSANCYNSSSELITCGCTVHFNCHFKKSVDYRPKNPSDLKPIETFFGKYELVWHKCMKGSDDYNPYGDVQFVDLGFMGDNFVVMRTPRNSILENIEMIATAPLSPRGSADLTEFETVTNDPASRTEIHHGIKLERVSNRAGIDVSMKTYKNTFSAVYDSWTNFYCQYDLKKK